MQYCYSVVSGCEIGPVLIQHWSMSHDHQVWCMPLCLGGGLGAVVRTACLESRRSPALALKFQRNKMFPSRSLVKNQYYGGVGLASDRQGSNLELCICRTVSSHHPQEVLLAQFSLYVHKGGLNPIHLI